MRLFCIWCGEHRHKVGDLLCADCRETANFAERAKEIIEAHDAKRPLNPRGEGDSNG